MSLLPPFDGREWFQIALLGLAALYVLRAIAHSPLRHAASAIAGILAIYLGMRVLGLEILTGILEQAFQLGILIVVILFHGEIRTWLVRMGKRLRGLVVLAGVGEDGPRAAPKVVDELARAVDRIAQAGAGALIAVEMEDSLDEVAETGYRIGALLSASLLEAIFTSRSPLHDGAVIVREGRIVAAGAVLPLHLGDILDLRRTGTRHRAALGLSERTDAAVLVVSEERGTINLVREGRFMEIDREHLRREMLSILTHDDDPTAVSGQGVFLRAGGRFAGWAAKTYHHALDAWPGSHRKTPGGESGHNRP